MTKIGSKLLVSYFLLIICIFFITSLSFRLISQQYLLHETEAQLTKEAKIISQILGKAALSNKLVQEKVAGRRALVISERLLSSKVIIWTDEDGVIYSDLEGMTLERLDRLSTGPARKYVTETVTIAGKNGKVKGYVTLAARLDDIQNINGLMRRSQLISLVISALIALLLGVFFEKKITKPVRKLSEHMKGFSVREAVPEIRIDSKDEIGELAESFNALALKLKQYDEDQKTFFHNASHELKTPLMAIQGNAEGILDGVVTGEDVEKSLNVIIAESQRLKGIVEGITYLAKLENARETFKFNDGVVLGEVVEEAAESMRALAEQKGIGIVLDVSRDIRLRMDADKMKQALINLLGNSIRYARSEIVVRGYVQGAGAGSEAAAGSTSTGFGAGKRHVTIIEILDDGPGLAAGEEEKVFQRFYSGTSGGSGIGLSITKAIIEAHNGTIAAANRKTGGAIFTITL